MLSDVVNLRTFTQFLRTYGKQEKPKTHGSKISLWN